MKDPWGKTSGVVKSGVGVRFDVRLLMLELLVVSRSITSGAWPFVSLKRPTFECQQLGLLKPLDCGV